MKKEELEKKLETLQRPAIMNDEHKQQLKLTLLNAKRTAWWGTLLIIIPALFILGVFLKYALGIGFIFDPLDKYIFGPLLHSKYKFLEPLLLFLLPLFVLVINIIAITHFSIKKLPGNIDMMISIKRKWWNWLIIIISAIIVAIIFLYALKGDK
jgi:hypothetical protein